MSGRFGLFHPFWWRVGDFEEGLEISRNWVTAHSLVFWQCLGTIMAPQCVSFSLLIEDQGLVGLSAILDPFDSNWFMLCPWAMSFFQKLCPAPLPPVIHGVEKSWTRLSDFHFTSCLLVQVASVMSGFLWPMDYSLPGSSVYRILQARILEWVDMPSSRESSSHFTSTLATDSVQKQMWDYGYPLGSQTWKRFATKL